MLFHPRYGSVASSYGLRWMIGSNLEQSVALAGYLQIAGSTPGLDPRVLSDLPSPFYYQGDIIANQLDIRHASLTAASHRGQPLLESPIPGRRFTGDVRKLSGRWYLRARSGQPTLPIVD